MDYELGKQLNALLPVLQRNRQRWPLWTYHRERWSATGSPWLDRWQFSGSYLHASFAGLDMPDYWARAATLLIAHQTAPVIPDRLSLDVMPRFSAGVLDFEDASALVTDVVGALNDGLFLRMLEFAKAVASRSTHEPGETPEALALDLCRRVGLLPARQRGAATGFTDETVRALDGEARAIVEAVRDDPPPDEVTPASELLDGDPAWRKKALQIEKEKRGAPLVAEPLIARWLLFPFFRLDEIEAAIKDGTTAQAAYRLVVGRFVGTMTEGTYRKMLSR